MPRAVNKIYYNIDESDYSFTTDKGVTFYFSKIQYLEKFMEQYKDNRKTLKVKLVYMYGIEIDFDEYFDFVLYLKLEKNGFRVLKGGEVVCQSHLIFVGHKHKRKD